MPQKKLLPSNKLIQHMKDTGIQFNICNEQHAQHFLEEHNYYFKLSSYRKNYDKIPCGDNAGKYIDLDFAYLQELSTIDMYLRYLILELCLDIEHSLKVSLLNDIESNANEDGYNIVKIFNQQNNSIAKVKQYVKNSYAKEIINKYSNNCPIWVFCEIISFGDLCKLCNFYNHFYPNRLPYKPTLLYPVRDIRNGCAHSNCLICNLRAQNVAPNNEITNWISTFSSFSKTKRLKMLRNKSIHDLVTLLYMYNAIVKSEYLRKIQLKKFSRLINRRLLKHRNYFINNPAVTNAYIFIREALAELLKND